MMQMSGAFELSRRLSEAGSKLPLFARAGLRKAAHIIMDGMKEEELTGQYLNVVTDRLRSSWQVLDVRSTGPDELANAITTNVPYAAVHEFGFRGTVTVREHLRNTPKQAAKKRLRLERRAKRLNEKGRERWAREQEAKVRHRAASRERRPLQSQERAARRSAGTQAGIFALSGKLAERQAKTGRSVVRSHGRMMNVRAKHYARDACTRFGPRAEQAYADTVMSVLGEI